MNTAVRIAAFGLIAAMAAGCTDLKPIQTQIDDLKSQISKVNSNAAAHQASDDAKFKSAADASASAARAAAAAQSTANQALAAAKAAQSGVDATNEKIDRMFKRSVSK